MDGRGGLGSNTQKGKNELRSGHGAVTKASERESGCVGACVRESVRVRESEYKTADGDE